MLRPLEECIDCVAFASLILDYEFEEEPAFDLPAWVSCRILIDGVYETTIHAATRDEAIEIFQSGAWR